MTRRAAKDAYSGEWLTLVASLPVDDIAARMQALRTIESLGAGILREGVYLLPSEDAHRAAFTRLAEDIQRAGGAAHVLVTRTLDTAEAVELAALFDRSPRYAELIKTVESLRAGYGVAEPAAIGRVLAKQRRDLRSITELDFFDSRLRGEAERTLANAEAIVRKLVGTAAEEAPMAADPERRSEYFRRTWATRAPVTPDRGGAAWLIRRFIDPEAKLTLLAAKDDPPESALGFGYAGAIFAKPDGRGGFDALLLHFDMTSNPGLGKIGHLLRALEGTGEKPVEAAGVESLLANARRRAHSESEVLAEAEKTFDMLYEAYFAKAEKR